MKVSADRFNAWVVRGDRATYSTALRLIREASEIVFFQLSSLPGRVLRRVLEGLQAARRRGVHVNVKVDQSLANVKLQSLKVLFETFNPQLEEFILPLNTILSDFKHILVFYAPTAGQLEVSEPVGLHIETGKLGPVLREKAAKLFPEVYEG